AVRRRRRGCVRRWQRGLRRDRSRRRRTTTAYDRGEGDCRRLVGGAMSTVLVVDDDLDIARFIEVNLKLEGFDVLLAHDGEQALGIIAEALPDLALLDVMMPRI